MVDLLGEREKKNQGARVNSRTYGATKNNNSPIRLAAASASFNMRNCPDSTGKTAQSSTRFRSGRESLPDCSASSSSENHLPDKLFELRTVELTPALRRILSSRAISLDVG